MLRMKKRTICPMRCTHFLTVVIIIMILVFWAYILMCFVAFLLSIDEDRIGPDWMEYLTDVMVYGFIPLFKTTCFVVNSGICDVEEIHGPTTAPLLVLRNVSSSAIS